MKTIVIEKINPDRVTVLYNSDKGILSYLVDRIPHHGFIGKMADQKFYEALERGFNVQLIEKTMDNKAKIRQFYAILAKKGLMDLKPDILAKYGVRSTTELTEQQLDDEINHLQTVQVNQELRDARSIVLNLLSKLNITGSREDGWKRVNEYLLQPRISGKVLYEMNTTELKDCSLRLRSIIQKQQNHE